MERGKINKGSLQYQPRNPSLEDYWQECNSFHESNHLDDDEDDAAKTPDEGEAEEDWLREAGFESLVEREAVEDHYFEEILSTLTARQRAVVKRRLHTVQRSKSKKKNAIRRRADVRQVFSQPGSEHPVKDSNADSLESLPDTGNVSASAPCSMNLEQHQVHKSALRSSPQEDDQQTFKTGRSSSSSSSVLPPFLRTGHTGGFNLWEHGRSVDSESPNSVEVLKYESRSFSYPENRQSSESRNSDSPEISYQGIASRLDPTGEIYSVLDCMGKDHVPISELAEEERVMVRSLAVIEVAALMDSHGLVPSRRKRNRKKGRDNVVFGASLSSLLELDRRRCPGLKIPLIYQWILHHLDENGLTEEGLMRLAGSVQKVELLKAETERGYLLSPMQVEASVRHSSVHDVAVFLKQLVRHLPEPLLTNSHIDAFLQVPSIPSVQDQIIALNLLVLVLPDVHREFLQELLFFLSKVVDFEHLNRMTLANVAMIMAPNIFPLPRLKKGYKNNDLASEVTVAALSSKVTQLLIKFGQFLGSVPRELLMQARMQTMHSNKKHGKKSENRKTKSERFKLEKDVLFSARSWVIRVHVTSFCNPCSVPVAVDESTTAGEVVEKVAMLFDELKDPRHVMLSSNLQGNRNKFQRARTSSEPVFVRQECAFRTQKSGDCLKDHFLYQIGHNFGERMLDHSAAIFSFLHVPGTPTAHGSSWEIRCHH